MMMLKRILLFIGLAVFIQVAIGQVSRDSKLFLALKKQDSIFFERAFNLCDFFYLEGAVDKDLVFYHDKGGIQNREKFLENTRKNICGNMAKKPIRKPDEQSLAVFPLYDNNVLYGVIQTGTHKFYMREKGREDILTGQAKFTHVYLLKNEKWILKEVLSYDH